MKKRNNRQFAFRVSSDVWDAILKRAEEEALTPSAVLRQVLVKTVRDWEKNQEKEETDNGEQNG